MSAQAATLLGLLSDDDRLRAVAALALGARTPSEVAAAAGLDVRRAGRALARLSSGGLVEQEKGGYRLLTERFREALESLDRPAPEHTDSGLGPDADRVLGAFFRERRSRPSTASASSCSTTWPASSSPASPTPSPR